MDKERFNILISLYRNIETDYSKNINENLEILKKIYENLGKKIEIQNKKNIDIHKFFIDKIIEITKEILDTLNEEEKQIFLRDIPLVIRICILNDDEKIEKTNQKGAWLFEYDIKLITKSLKYNDDEKIEKLNIIDEDDFIAEIICSMQSDEKKLKILEETMSDESEIYISDIDKIRIIKTIKKDENKINALKYIEDEEQKFESLIIRSLQNDGEKIKHLENIQDEINKVSIIITIKDDNKKVQCLHLIENEELKSNIIESIKNEEIKVKQLETISDEKNKVEIIKSLKNDLNKIKCIENIENQKYRYKIIREIKEDKNKIQALELLSNEQYKTIIITTIEKDEEKIKLLKTIENEKNKIEIIKSIKDDDKKINFLNQIQDESYKIEIIKSIKDDDKKIEQLVNIPYEKYRVAVIATIQSDNKKISFLGNIKEEKDRLRIVGLMSDFDKKIEALEYLTEEASKLKIIGMISNPEKRLKALGKINQNYAKAYDLIYSVKNSNIDNKYKKIGLPKEMTIGVEIEAEGENHGLLPDKLLDWDGKEDFSLSDRGKEYASPVMHDNEKDVENIYKINKILNLMEMKATNRCGAHVHIGANYITSEYGFSELVELWGNTEEIYYLISNEKGELPRKGVEKYATPVSQTLEEAQIEKIPKDKFILIAKSIFENNRYKSINFMNINNSKNTIEFRLANGTLNPDTWIENIRLFGRTIEAAEELGQIAQKLGKKEELTEEEKVKYTLKEMLKDDISLNSKMDILMQILFSEEEREIYYERFRENNKLNSENQRLESLSFGKVDFKKVYDKIEIPSEIIDKIKEEKELEQNQR